jgi:hypothetical protein
LIQSWQKTSTLRYLNSDYPLSVIALGKEYVRILNDEKDTLQKDDFREERKELLRRLSLLSSRGDQEATLLLKQIQHFCENVQNNKRFSIELEAFKTIDETALAKLSKKQEAENIGEYAGAHIGTSIFATVGAGGGAVIGGIAGTALLGPVGAVIGSILGMVSGAAISGYVGQVITERITTDITLFIDKLTSLIKISIPLETKEVGVTSAVIGLMIGTILGSLLIPIPGVGTVLGFALGAAAGGISGAIAGGIIGSVTATLSRWIGISSQVIRISANMALTGGALGSVLGGIIGLAIAPGPGVFIGAAIGGSVGALGVGSITCIAAQLISKYKPNLIQEKKAVEKSACLSVGLSIGFGIGALLGNVLAPVLDLASIQISPVVTHLLQLGSGLIFSGIGYAANHWIKPLTLAGQTSSPDKLENSINQSKPSTTKKFFRLLAMRPLKQKTVEVTQENNQIKENKIPSIPKKPIFQKPVKILIEETRNLPTLKF